MPTLTVIYAPDADWLLPEIETVFPDWDIVLIDVEDLTSADSTWRRIAVAFESTSACLLLWSKRLHAAALASETSPAWLDTIRANRHGIFQLHASPPSPSESATWNQTF